MGKEEQIEEREVLESIFPTEITDISDNSYRISINIEVTPQDGDDAPAPIILLTVSFPESYPDTPPDLDISAPLNAPKHPHLDIAEDKARLLSSLDDTIEESLGMAMIFTVVSTLKDSAELLITERQRAITALKEVEAQKVEEEENRKFHGTSVTKETFLDWRRKFRKEMEALEEERARTEKEEAEKKGGKVKKEVERLTGKQLWERGLAGKIEDEDEGEGDGEDAVSELKALKIEG